MGSLAKCVSLAILKTALFICYSHLEVFLRTHRLFAVKRKTVTLLAHLSYRDNCRETFVWVKNTYLDVDLKSFLITIIGTKINLISLSTPEKVV